jgi:hypothetical protein
VTVLRGWNQSSIEDAVVRLKTAALARVPEFARGAPWSLCELGLDEDDYRSLAAWFRSLRRSTVELYTESGTVLRGTDGQIVSCTAAGAGITRSAAFGWLALALVCEHHHRQSTRSIWQDFRSQQPRDPSATSALFQGDAQPSVALKDAIRQAAEQLHLRHFFVERNRQRWFDSVMVQGPFPGVDEVRELASWLDGFPCPVWVTRVRTHETQGCETFKTLWRVLQSFRRRHMPIERCLVTVREPSMSRWLPREDLERWLRTLDAVPRRVPPVTSLVDVGQASSDDTDDLDDVGDRDDSATPLVALRLRWAEHARPALTATASVSTPIQPNPETLYEHDVEVFVDGHSVGWLTLEGTREETYRYVFADGSTEIPLSLRAMSSLVVTDGENQRRLHAEIEVLPTSGPALRAFTVDGKPCEPEHRDARWFIAPSDAVAAPAARRRYAENDLVVIDLPFVEGRSITVGETVLLGPLRSASAPRSTPLPVAPSTEPPTLSRRVGGQWFVLDGTRDGVDRADLERSLVRISGDPRLLDENATLWAGIHLLGPARRGLRTLPDARGYGEALIVRCESAETAREFVVARAVTSRGALRRVTDERPKGLRLQLGRKLRIAGTHVWIIDRAGNLLDHEVPSSVAWETTDDRVDELMIPLDLPRPRVVALVQGAAVLGAWTAHDWSEGLAEVREPDTLLRAARALRLPILAPDVRQIWAQVALADPARALQAWVPVLAPEAQAWWRGVPLPKDEGWLEVLRQLLPVDWDGGALAPDRLRRLIGLKIFPEGFSVKSSPMNVEVCSSLLAVSPGWAAIAARHIQRHPSGHTGFIRHIVHHVLRIPMLGSVPRQDEVLWPLLVMARSLALARIGRGALEVLERQAPSDRPQHSHLHHRAVREWLFLHAIFDLAQRIAQEGTAR